MSDRVEQSLAKKVQHGGERNYLFVLHESGITRRPEAPRVAVDDVGHQQAARGGVDAELDLHVDQGTLQRRPQPVFHNHKQLANK